MSVMRDAGDQAPKEKNGLGKALLIGGMLLVFLFTGKSFAISFGQGLPAAMKQTVNVNEKLQRGTGTLTLAANLKNASGGPDKKLRRVIGGSILETWIGTGNPLKINTKSPLAGRFLQTDPIGYRDSMNLYQAFNQNPMNYLDPLGKWMPRTHESMTEKAYTNEYWRKIKENNNFYKSIIYSPNKGTMVLIRDHLVAGSTDPDFGFDEWGLVEPKDRDERWHSDYDPNFKGGALEYRKLIIDTAIAYILKARILFFTGSHPSVKPPLGKNAPWDTPWYVIRASRLLGEVLHMIQDSYSPVHAFRDEKMDIRKFPNYQGIPAHQWEDTYDKEHDKHYHAARVATEKVLDLFFGGYSDGDFAAKLSQLLNDIYTFGQNVKWGID